MLRFETPRLLLREWTVDDAEDAYAIFGDPEVHKWSGGGKLLESVDEMRGIIESRWVPRHAALTERGYGFWASADRETNRVVGVVLFKPLPADGGVETEDVEIGWYVVRHLWGNGYAAEGSKAVADYALGEFGLKELRAITKPGNDRSVAITRKLGMKPMGRTTKYYDGLEADLFIKTLE